jgi:ABC-type molybdenum transport system ATPase subunit/photorepair protein PhrA
VTEEKKTDAAHADRVNTAFASFTERLKGRLDEETRESVEKLRQAASAKDADTTRQQLSEVRERHTWLYRELAEHPEIATLLDELALMGL